MQQEKMMKATLSHIDLGLYEEADELVSFQKISKTDKVAATNKLVSKKTSHRIDKRSMIYDNW